MTETRTDVIVKTGHLHIASYADDLQKFSACLYLRGRFCCSVKYTFFSGSAYHTEHYEDSLSAAVASTDALQAEMSFSYWTTTTSSSSAFLPIQEIIQPPVEGCTSSIKILTPPTKKIPGVLWLKQNVFGDTYVISAYFLLLSINVQKTVTNCNLLNFFFRKTTAKSNFSSFQTLENIANWRYPLNVQKPKVFQLQGASPPGSLSRGSATGPRWEQDPQNPIPYS